MNYKFEDDLYRLLFSFLPYIYQTQQLKPEKGLVHNEKSNRFLLNIIQKLFVI